jgi:hypothetical protein
MADKLPYFPFYADDWLSDEKLRACSSASIGLWIDMLCLMHKNDRRGYLQLNGKPVTAAQLARMTGRATDEVSQQLAELMDAGVPSATEDGILYSRRMVRDERVRQVRSVAGKKGGDVTGGLLKQKAKQKSSKGQANGQAKDKQNAGSGSDNGIASEGEGGAGEEEAAEAPAKFEEFWEAYPRKEAKQDAVKAWDKLGPSAVLLKQMLEAIAQQKGWRKWREGYISNPATWLNGRRWEDQEPPVADERSNGNGRPRGSMGANPSRIAAPNGKYQGRADFGGAAAPVAQSEPRPPPANGTLWSDDPSAGP